jgi:hypothetical protein
VSNPAVAPPPAGAVETKTKAGAIAAYVSALVLFALLTSTSTDLTFLPDWLETLIYPMHQKPASGGMQPVASFWYLSLLSLRTRTTTPQGMYYMTYPRATSVRCAVTRARRCCRYSSLVSRMPQFPHSR